MAKRQFDFSEVLASSMDNIMNDADYQNLFKAPKMVFANTEDANPIKDAVNTLLLAAKHLDEMGFSKSASKALETVDALISEATEEEEEEEEEEEDEDKACADDKDKDEEDLIPPGI